MTRRRTRVRLSGLAIAAGMVLAGLGAPLPAQAAEPSLTVGYVPVLGLSPALLANSLGIYQQEHVRVRLVSFPAGPALYQAMAGGRVQMAYAGVPALIEWASRGLPVQAVAKVEDGTFSLLAAKGYHGPLRGASIGDAGEGSGQDVMLRGFLLPRHHLAPTAVKVRYLPQSDMLPALAGRQIDMALVGAPLSTLGVLRGDRVVAWTRDPGFVLLATKSFIQHDPRVVTAMIEAHRRAIAYINRHPAQAAAILARDLKVPAVTTAHGVVSPAAIVERGLKGMHFSALFTPQDFQLYRTMDQRLWRLKLIAHPVNIRPYFNFRWIPR